MTFPQLRLRKVISGESLRLAKLRVTTHFSGRLWFGGGGGVLGDVTPPSTCPHTLPFHTPPSTHPPVHTPSTHPLSTHTLAQMHVGIHPLSKCMLGYTHPLPKCMLEQISPPVDRMTDTHLWKHYLPTTSFAGGNKWWICGQNKVLVSSARKPKWILVGNEGIAVKLR